MKKKGITLIELIVAMAILSIIMLAVYSVFDSSNTTLSKAEKRIELQEEANVIFRKIEKDVDMASILSSSASTLLTVTNEDGSVVIYNITGNRISRNSISINDNTEVETGSFEVNGQSVYVRIKIYLKKDKNSSKKESMEFTTIVNKRNWR